MRCAVLVVALSLATACFAGPKHWEDAAVLKLIVGQGGTEAVIVSTPGVTYGAAESNAGKHTRGTYWLKTERFTYVIPNYCKANFLGIQWWLYLTVGGHTKISVDSARTLTVVDDDGKQRKVHVIERIANDTHN